MSAGTRRKGAATPADRNSGAQFREGAVEPERDAKPRHCVTRDGGTVHADVSALYVIMCGTLVGPRYRDSMTGRSRHVVQ